MNILFLLKSLEIGGVEVVTAVLANEFIKHGHNVFVFSFLEGKNSVSNRFDDNIKIYIGNDYSDSSANVNYLREILKNNTVDLVINQWGLPLVPIKTLKKASKGLDIKIISVYHNAPSFNGRIQQINIKLLQTTNLLKRSFLILMKKLMILVTSRAMGYIYNKSDKFLILSDSYINDFKKFTKIKNAFNLSVIANPITIENDTYLYDLYKKAKEIIYVGRLDFLQKRVYRIIDTWKYLEDRFPEWCLTIIGNGDERENLEKQVEMLGLNRVHFVGYKAPNEYYKRASVLILTSEYEGFPLVLTECMSYGVVPAVYGSYSAVYDIIDDGIDGVILPFHSNKEFDAEIMSEKIAELMNNDTLRNEMALNALAKSKNYNIETIYNKWNQLFNTLISNQ